MTLLTRYPGMVNSPVTALAASITSSTSSIPIEDASKIPDAPNLAVIGTGEDAETIRYTAKAGNVLTAQRAFQGIAKAWAAETPVARYFTEYDYRALSDGLSDHESRLIRKLGANGLIALAVGDWVAYDDAFMIEIDEASATANTNFNFGAAVLSSAADSIANRDAYQAAGIWAGMSRSGKLSFYAASEPEADIALYAEGWEVS